MPQERNSFLSLADFKGTKFSPHLTRFDILLKVAAVALKKLEKNTQKEKMAENVGFDDAEGNPDGEMFSRRQRLMREKLLKRPMEEKEAKPVRKKKHNEGKQFMSSTCKSLKMISHNKSEDCITDIDEGNFGPGHTLDRSGVLAGYDELECSLNSLGKDYTRSESLGRSVRCDEPECIVNSLAEDCGRSERIRVNTLRLTRHNGASWQWNDTESDRGRMSDDWIVGRKKKRSLSNRDWIMNVKKKRRKNFPGNDGPSPPPSLPEEFEREIMSRYGDGRPKPTRLIQKTLFATDISTNHGRISIPCSQIETLEFLRDEEITQLRRENPITVPLIHRPTRNGVPLNHPPLVESLIEFRQWDLHKNKYRDDPTRVSSVYVLRTAWNDVVLQDELNKGDVIQIWAFRDDDNSLCMALVVVERAQKRGNPSNEDIVILEDS